MMLIQATIDVARSPREVFDFLPDQANRGKIDDALVDFSPQPTWRSLELSKLRRPAA